MNSSGLRSPIWPAQFKTRFFVQADPSSWAENFSARKILVEAVAAVAHHFAGLADIAELLGELQQANRADDLLFSRGRDPPTRWRGPQQPASPAAARASPAATRSPRCRAA